MSHVAAVLLAWEGVSKVAREMDRTFDHDASHRTWYLMWPALAGSVESDCRVLDDLDPLVVFGVDETGEPIGRDLHKFTAGIRERGLHLRAGRSARSFPEAGANPTAQRLCTLNSCDGSVQFGRFHFAWAAAQEPKKM